MTMDPNKAQDVWKDVGQHVQFTVLELNRTDQAQEKAVIEEFADRYQAILRSLRIRDAQGDLKASFGLSNAAWDYLFPGAAKPKELETSRPCRGLSIRCRRQRGICSSTCGPVTKQWFMKR